MQVRRILVTGNDVMQRLSVFILKFSGAILL